MTETTYTLSDHIHDGMTEPEWVGVIGKRAVHTTWDGERMVGTVEEPTRWSSGFPIIRFADGKWARCDDVIVLA